MIASLFFIWLEVVSQSAIFPSRFNNSSVSISVSSSNAVLLRLALGTDSVTTKSPSNLSKMVISYSVDSAFWAQKV